MKAQKPTRTHAAPAGPAADRRWHRAQVAWLKGCIAVNPAATADYAAGIAYHRRRVEELNDRIAGRRIDGPV